MKTKTTKKSKRDREFAARQRRIKQVMDKVNEITDYAMDNLIVQPAALEELELLLNEVVK